MSDTAAATPARTSAFGDLEHELAGTRRVLERVPEEHWSWRPHDKSMSLSRMATHLIEVLRIAESAATADRFDLAHEHVPDPAGREELLRRFDEAAERLLGGVRAVQPEAWSQPWALVRGEQVLRTVPRAAALRSFGVNHHLHHRGQLTVYLRLLGVPVPGLYGPSADER
ncbi:MAG TPA: DinB family protein [Longimicrobiales bacterium]|nr:DinB family protein [Longimicrobiales bacterium]